LGLALVQSTTTLRSNIEMPIEVVIDHLLKKFEENFQF